MRRNGANKMRIGTDIRSTSARTDLNGSVHLVALSILMALFVSGGCYLYSVNASAVQGYRIRTLENQIEALKQQNAELKIAEADLRSLDRIATASTALDMQPLGAVTYLEAKGPVALK